MTTTKPFTLPVLSENIPPELKAHPHWVMWRWLERDGKTTKPPIQTNGKLAKVNDPSTWCDYQTAITAYEKGKFAGIGIVLTAEDNLVAVDLDKCRDPVSGVISPEMAALSGRLPTYCEVSPSGTGLRLIATGVLPQGGGSRKGQVELYQDGRYVTITGHRLNGEDSIRDCTTELAAICAEVFGTKAEETPTKAKAAPKAKTPGKTSPSSPSVGKNGDECGSHERPPPRPPLEDGDEDLVSRIHRSKQGPTFSNLASGPGADHSADDLALCNILAFWCAKDAAQMDRLFRQTGLMRPKWDQKHSSDGRTYGQVTISKAIAGCRETFKKSDTHSYKDDLADLIADNPTTPKADFKDMPPEPLRPPMVPAEMYHVDRLGSILSGAVHALNEIVKAPIALCAQSVLAAASLAVQAHFDVRLPWDKVCPTSLFFLTIAESGERKSAVDDAVLGAGRSQERTDMAQYDGQMEIHSIELAAWQKAIDVAKNGKKTTAKEISAAMMAVGPKPLAPIAPIRFCSDPTVEGLFKLLAIGQPSVGMFSDEGGLLIGGHAMNSDNSTKTFSRLSKFWDGAAFDRVRAGDGASVLYGRRLSLHQQAQPEVMTELLSDRVANGQGFLARCLVAWPESTISTRMITRFESVYQTEGMRRLFAVLKTLFETKPKVSPLNDQELEPVVLTLDPAAHQIALNAANAFEDLQGKGKDLESLRDRASKALEQACRIAGVLTVIEYGMSARTISKDSLINGLYLIQWYLAEAMRIRAAAVVPPAVTDAEELVAWLEEQGIKRFRSTQVFQFGPKKLRDKTAFADAIGTLVTSGHLVAMPVGTEINGVKCRKSWEVRHGLV